MKVLFLDDESWRHEALTLMLNFSPRERSYDITHVYNAEEFRQALRLGPFDMVCLDHDRDVVRAETGYHAALDFVASAHQPTMCLVHSWNPEGATRISRVLRKAGHQVMVAPFGTSLKHLFDSLAAA